MDDKEFLSKMFPDRVFEKCYICHKESMEKIPLSNGGYDLWCVSCSYEDYEAPGEIKTKIKLYSLTDNGSIKKTVHRVWKNLWKWK